MRSPLSYLGGKSRLAKTIVGMIPRDHTTYVEPFCGAAWVFFHKDQSEVEVLNDADGELVNFWRVIQNHLQPFLEYYKFAIVSRKLFDLEKIKRPETLTDIQRAVRYFYLQKLCFGGRPTGRTFGATVVGSPRLNLSAVEERLIEVHWRLERVTIENLDVCRCIEMYDRPTTLFYLDPPYFGTAGYEVSFAGPDYSRLVKALQSINGRFILSINDVPAMREAFSGFTLHRAGVKYSVSRQAGARGSERGELIVTNFSTPVRARFDVRNGMGSKAAVKRPVSRHAA